MPLAVCATPIGNLEDVTLRVLAELRDADFVLCEDTRRTRVLLERHGITARLESHHRHNEAARLPSLLERLREGSRVALVSDAGLPGVNDPGSRLIAAAVAEDIEVTVLPGPSAVDTALVASALRADRYQFVGYLPRRVGELRALAVTLASWPGAVVAFESPRRLPASLRVLSEALGPRPAAVCRELTKRFEEVARGSLDELAERSPSLRAGRSRSSSGVRRAAWPRPETTRPHGKRWPSSSAREPRGGWPQTWSRG
jgi:16S rRNA (cytidine1402-2'-O)-methyltransferase